MKKKSPEGLVSQKEVEEDELIALVQKTRKLRGFWLECCM